MLPIFPACVTELCLGCGNVTECKNRELSYTHCIQQFWRQLNGVKTNSCEHSFCLLFGTITIKLNIYCFMHSDGKLLHMKKVSYLKMS